MTVRVVNQFGPYLQPLSQSEKLVYGESAQRDPASGFIFQQGSGAPPKAIQAAIFQQQLQSIDWIEHFMATEQDWPAINPDLADIVKVLKMERNI
jgi:hypothetical protein